MSEKKEVFESESAPKSGGDSGDKFQTVQTFELRPFSEIKTHSVSCTLRLSENTLQVHYALKATPKAHEGIELPDFKESPERKIGLWERTCFEMFIKQNKQPEYFEFNFAPSGDWNCFHFSSRGDDLVEYPGIQEIPINSTTQTSDQGHKEFHLTALVNLTSLGRYFYKSGGMLLNLTSVILEPAKGRRSYWALEHLNTVPDFHDINTFKAKI